MDDGSRLRLIRTSGCAAHPLSYSFVGWRRCFFNELRTILTFAFQGVWGD